MINKTVSFQVEHEEKEYSGEAEVEIKEDHHWGSDADGNRGVYRAWVEEIDIISLYNEDDQIEMDINNIPEDLREAIEDAIEDKEDTWEKPE